MDGNCVIFVTSPTLVLECKYLNHMAIGLPVDISFFKAVFTSFFFFFLPVHALLVIGSS